ncbi:MAG TPA: hypothetical protein VFE98_04075 [Candidatus Bathyarchaeia archaeon]|nr:hypothetical protein [Candidatus Bathyarchaeia archaeon]
MSKTFASPGNQAPIELMTISNIIDETKRDLRSFLVLLPNIGILTAGCEYSTVPLRVLVSNNSAREDREGVLGRLLVTQAPRS